MREFTKSMMSYSWAMSLFGVQQMLNMMTPQNRQRGHPATNAFNSVTQVTEEEFNGAIKAAFTAGDNIQRGLVDLTFGLLSFGMFDPNRMTRAAVDLGQRAAQAANPSGSQEASRSQATGWG